MVNWKKLKKFFDFLKGIEFILRKAPVFELYNLKKESRWLMVWSTLLSARTTDKSLIKVLKIIKERFVSPEDVVKVSISDLEEIFKPLGFYRSKAKVFWLFNKEILERNLEIPKNLEELIKLPGVGLKIASIILNDLYGCSFIGIDTHVYRILNRVGVTKAKNPNQMWKILHKSNHEDFKEIFSNLNKYVVAFGQTICKVKPRCEKCGFKTNCEFFIDKNQ